MKVNIACLQMASKPYDWDYNIEKATAMIREAAGNGANICILPEVFIPGYSLTYENFRTAETLDGATVSTLTELAKALKIYILGSIIEKTENQFYNTMLVIGPEGLLDTYRKIHVFAIEQKYWKPGNAATIVDTEYGVTSRQFNSACIAVALHHVPRLGIKTCMRWLLCHSRFGAARTPPSHPPPAVK